MKSDRMVISGEFHSPFSFDFQRQQEIYLFCWPWWSAFFFILNSVERSLAFQSRSNEEREVHTCCSIRIPLARVREVMILENIDVTLCKIRQGNESYFSELHQSLILSRLIIFLCGWILLVLRFGLLFFPKELLHLVHKWPIVCRMEWYSVCLAGVVVFLVTSTKR